MLMMATSTCTLAAVTAVLLVLLAVPTDPFFLRCAAKQVDVNSSVANVLRVVRRCISPLKDGDNPSRARSASTPSTPWNPPYEEPPPSTEQLCAQNGFRCERHLVTTEDGYTLVVVHVLGRQGAPGNAGLPPVLVQHGMLMSSNAFLLRKDDGNLPLVLSDAGFDVWVGNYRANGVSPHVHTTLSPDSFQFWNYRTLNMLRIELMMVSTDSSFKAESTDTARSSIRSNWHELGLFDLPAMVDYVLAQTAHPDLFYIGHSMGSTGMLVLLSSRPEYNRKIRLASFLAPVAYVSQLRSRLFRDLFNIAPKIKHFLMTHRMWNVFPRSGAIHKFFDMLCLLPGAAKHICNPIIFDIAGWSPEHTFPDYAPMIAAYLPSGTTIRIMEHYYEVARTGKFRPLGYGMGDPNPGPMYNMSAVSAPVALFYAQNDNFVHLPDVDSLARDLPNLFHKFLVPDRTFNHFDFLLAADGQQLLYPELIATMRMREKSEQDKVDSSVNDNHIRPLRNIPRHLLIPKT